MNRITCGLSAFILLFACYCQADPNNPNTDWFKDARYGAFMHFLPGDDRQLSQVKDFDVAFLAKQLEEAGARYFVITLGQNSGYFISPNATYDRFTGYAAGERYSTRDLPLDLFNALQPRGIKLMLYLPCQVPNQDARAQRAFGLREGPADQPLSIEFARKWAEVIQEWADRYGDKVAGWWFDGGYQHIHFNEAIAQVYEKAVKHGNPKAIATYNPGGQSHPLHRCGGLHRGGTERTVECLPGFPLAGWLAVARADLPGLLLGATRYTLLHPAMGGLGESRGCA